MSLSFIFSPKVRTTNSYSADPHLLPRWGSAPHNSFNPSGASVVFDVAIIGAGLAGLTCAQQLQQAGYSVVVVEKSRGVGGRVATRRLHDTRADHGLRYLESQGPLSQQLIEILDRRGIVQAWTDTIYELHSAESGNTPAPHASKLTRYVASTGMTAVAKFLASGLEIWLGQRVNAIAPTAEQSWFLTLESGETLTAGAVVVAIPAPQALILLEPLAQTSIPAEFLDSLRSVEFSPCLSVMAGYPMATDELPLPDWKACTLPDDSDLAWIGLDSSKRLDAQIPVFVLQSTAEFAQPYLDAADLKPAGQYLLSRAAQLLIPWLDRPDWLQVHRWRYAFPSRPLNRAYLDAATPSPLVCCGDWCGGKAIESALNSGLAAASQINQQLKKRSLPGERFLDALINL
ncbi:MAG TPA: FAD-dependent oxidoreductase [Allocoleopsis sp.]